MDLGLQAEEAKMMAKPKWVILEKAISDAYFLRERAAAPPPAPNVTTAPGTGDAVSETWEEGKARVARTSPEPGVNIAVALDAAMGREPRVPTQAADGSQPAPEPQQETDDDEEYAVENDWSTRVDRLLARQGAPRETPPATDALRDALRHHATSGAPDPNDPFYVTQYGLFREIVVAIERVGVARDAGRGTG